MRNLLYTIAVLCIIAWALGFFFFSVGALVHTLLIIAVISLLLGLIRKGGIE